jgi:hypothetical protein
VVEHKHTTAAFAGFDRSHHPGSSGADDDGIPRGYLRLR